MSNPPFELGVTTFVETYPDPHTGDLTSHGDRLRQVVEEAQAAEAAFSVVGVEPTKEMRERVGARARAQRAYSLRCGGREALISGSIGRPLDRSE